MMMMMVLVDGRIDWRIVGFTDTFDQQLSILLDQGLQRGKRSSLSLSCSQNGDKPVSSFPTI